MVLESQGPDGGCARPGADGKGLGVDCGLSLGKEPGCLAEDNDDEESFAVGQQPNGGDDAGLSQAPAGGDGAFVYRDSVYGKASPED